MRASHTLRFVAALASLVGTAATSPGISAANLPPYLEPLKADAGQTTIRRISGDPGSPIEGIKNGRWGETVRHQYAKISAWNCNQSLLFLLNRGGTPELVFLDGTTFKPVDIRQEAGLREARWHPRDPETMVYVAGNRIGLWTVHTGKRRELGKVAGADVIGIGPWEGNLSDDGRWIVLAVGDPVTDVIPFDLQVGKSLPAIRHGFAEVDFATVSPSGRYVLVNGQIKPGKPDRSRVFDRATGRQVGTTWSEFGRPSHFDLTLDDEGADIAVGVSKSKPDEGSVIARRLRDGQVTRLTSAGFAAHTSARNILARGRVVASFAPNADSWGPYSDMMLSIGTSAKDDVEIIGRMHARVGDYWSQPQPTVSPDGATVLWASNRGGEAIAVFSATGWRKGKFASHIQDRRPAPPDGCRD